eukprot:TRINITY_DN24602_c0_g1_i1.p1 TRINITY_DN24602_c0_g1~~TRINITY_DN24602_c0_g1_i1.p1  ORF type:complete len:241 (+),score=45.15 TRINITY_DN24602_c0_g1_i1:46-768(+)
MAFLTGVDLEGRLHEDEELLALPAPVRRPRRPRPADDEALALEDSKPVAYGDLLKQTMALEEEDPLEELRRMIKRTRSKMDSQRKVLDGFISDVSQIKGMARNFSDTDTLALGDRASAAALPAPSKAAMREASSQRSLKAGASSALALAPVRPSSGSRESRCMPRRGGGALATSQSQPSLGSKGACAPPSAALLALQRDSAPLTVPQRRSPPGAGPLLTRELKASSSSRSSSLAALGRRR